MDCFNQISNKTYHHIDHQAAVGITPAANVPEDLLHQRTKKLLYVRVYMRTYWMEKINLMISNNTEKEANSKIV